MNIRADIKVIARQALTTTVCDTLLNANFTRWEEHKQSVPPSWLPLNWRRNTQIQMYWLWKWLENTILAPFQHERTNFYSICYFGSQIRFAHFMIMLGEELPSLPLLTARHWFFYHSDFWTTFLLCKTVLPWNSPLCWNIFYLSGLLSNLWLALKNRVCPEFTVLNIYF